MPRKNTPFEVVVHFTGAKSKQEIQSVVDDFYIAQVQKRLSESNLSITDKTALLDRLISAHRCK